MDKLAVELLTRIFALACTDGGLTSCPLSLVCKHFREVSRPFRFYTIALTGCPGKIRCLLDRLEEERAVLGVAAAPKVRHLFLKPEDVEQSNTPMVHAMGNEFVGDNRGTRTHSSTTSAITADQYADLVSIFLRMVAPDLYTLALLPYAYMPPMEQGIAFPVLRELTVHKEFVVDHMYDDDVVIAPEGPPLYPSLERLHVVGSNLRVEFWQHHAPNITHLRVSDIGYRGRARDFRKIHGEEWSNAPFPLLQVVILQLTVRPTVQQGCDETCRIWYERLIPGLWSSQSIADVPVYFPPPEKVPEEHFNMQKLRKEWEDRIQGRQGCWEVAEEHSRSAFWGDVPPPYLTPWLASAPGCGSSLG